MALYRTTPFVQHILRKHIQSHARVIDATVGNGHDTAFIATSLSHAGKLFGFDIQQRAIDNTTARLEQLAPSCSMTFFQQSHATMLPTLNDYVNKIDCIVFNLGYLPHADETITTNVDTTYSALLQALVLLKQKGIVVLVTYPGHEEGNREHEALERLLAKANPTHYFITTYQQVNNRGNPPNVFLIEKRTA